VYDCGIVFVRDPAALRAAMTAAPASYISSGANRDPWHHNPEMSRRARGIELWATLANLGRAGLRSLIERTCDHAHSFARGLTDAGFEVLNDVVLNQVLVCFGSPALTHAVIERVQRDGICWCGGTTWQGRVGMRISVSSWATTEHDVDVSLEAIIAAAEQSRTGAAITPSESTG
jgi:aromatic-L-amino-acid decarboxylase